MHAKYEVSSSNGSKVIAKVKVDNRQTNKQTDKQTDRTKTICPDHSIRGHKKRSGAKNDYRWIRMHIATASLHKSIGTVELKE